MPTIHLAAPGKSEFLQCFERLCSFLEIKPGLYRNFCFGFFAESKCDKTSRLGFGQNEIPNFWFHAGSPPDSSKATVWAIKRQQTGTSSNNPQRDQNNQSLAVTLEEPDTEAREANALFGNHRNMRSRPRHTWRHALDIRTRLSQKLRGQGVYSIDVLEKFGPA